MKKSAAKCIADHKLTDKTDKAFFDTYKKQAADNGATPEEAAQIGIDEVIANLKREKEYVLGEIENAGLQVPQSILDSLVIHEVDNDIQTTGVKDIKAEKEVSAEKEKVTDDVTTTNEEDLKEENKESQEEDKKIDAREKESNELPEEYTIEYHNSLLGKANNGDMSIDEFKAAYQFFKDNKDNILKLLNSRAYTVKQLQRMGYSWPRGDEKKSELADNVFDRLESFYLLNHNRPNLTFTMGQYDQGKVEQSKKITEIIEGMTQKDLDEYAESIKEAKAKKQADKIAREKAVENPETLDEFKEFVRVKGEGELSSDQLEDYDKLRTISILEKRQEEADRQATYQAKRVGDVDIETAETTHAKKGIDLYVVKLAGERIERDRFNDMRNLSKRFNGYYSRFNKNGAIPGFQFETKEDRQNFINAISGGEVQTTQEKPKSKQEKDIERLQAMSDKLIKEGDASLNQDRKTHTARYARMAASAESAAETQIADGKLLNAIVDGIKNNSIQYLQNITALTQLAELKRLLRHAEFKTPDELKDRDAYSNKTLKDYVTNNDYIRYAEFPDPEINRGGLEYMAKEMANLDGYKQIARSIQSILKKDKNEYINLDNYRTLDQAKIKKYANRPGVYDASQWIRDYIMRRDRLEKMGITSLPHLRMALRELASLNDNVNKISQEKKKAAKIKQLERDLVGRKIEGFFPTPKPVIEKLLEAADIQDGDKVLEPSAGKGDIADALKEAGANVDVVEFQNSLQEILKLKGHNVVGYDFLETEGSYSKIVMNPPFENFQDIDHVRHAYGLLNPGGRLVAIMGAGVNNSRKKAQEFRDWVDKLGGTIEPLPEGSFKSSFRPTGVNTVLVTIDKETDQGTALYSTGDKVEGQNATQLEQSLENKFGPLHKNINIVQNQNQLPSGLNKQGKIIKGVYDNNTGQVWLVADNIEAGQEMNVLNHEVGIHAALAKEPFFKDILAQVRDLRKSGDSLVKQAYQHAIKQGVPIKHRAEEALAYLVEANPDLPIVKRFLAKIRSFLYKHFGIAQKYIKLNDADLIELAKSSARSWNKAGVTGLGNLSDFGSGDIFLSSGGINEKYKNLLNFWQELAKKDGVFQTKASDKKDLADIAREADEDIEVEQYDSEGRSGYDDVTGEYIIYVPTEIEPGKMDYKPVMIRIHNNETVEMNASALIPGKSRGSAIYHIVSTFAHNNGYVFKGDRDGLSEKARIRRTENMISTALKYGTTSHIAPHPDQNIDWNHGDNEQNMLNLIKASYENIITKFPQVRNILYDPDSQTFYNKQSGRRYSDSALKKIAETQRNRSVLVGLATLKRAAISNTLLQGTVREGRGRVIQEASRQRSRDEVKDIFYSSGETPQFENPDPNIELNKRIREQHKGAWDKAKKILQRNLTARGLLPKSVQDLKITRDNNMGVTEIDIGELNRTLEKAVKKAYGKEIHKLTEQEQSLINKALGGNIPSNMDEDVKVAVLAMRQYIDRLSTDYAQILFNEAQQLQADGKDEAAAAKAALLETVANNIGSYINRSYKAFDDPKWYSKVPDDTLNNAREYLLSQYQAKADKYLEWADKAKTKGDTALAQKHHDNARNIENNMDRWAEATINTILKEGTAFDNMEAFIKESKLGAKDLSILKHRKQIAPEIRALLGEYQDPRITFTKSATKMSRLIFNQRFLDKVKEVGIGTFLFTEKDRPADAYKKIASGENYKPLDGLYTYPEVEQAFKDALGKENLPDWYRTIVQINGAVKYGKTVLSPTTAFRNWMSAFFFTMANGHFNMKHMVKSFQNIRGYFKHEGDLNYLRKLKQLGVVYDTPYAGEMMKLLDDSQIEDKYLSGNIKVREIMGLFTKFYQYGDDFWKIIGFENEVNLLMEYKKLTREQAEPLAAERIRNTYPTYSMTGRWVQKLRRFPLAGTFVSFPAEIIRTSFNMIKALQKDMSDPQLKGLARKRIAGLAIASGFAYALQEIAMSMLGVDDDEEEAIRNLAPKWSRNSNIMPVGRDEKGNLRYFDLSFLDPYNYWKRPINAVLREQPADKMAKDIAREMLEPFFGQDILFGAINEVWNNKKETGGRIYNPVENALDNSIDIFDHLRKNVQPGIFTNTERMYKAINDEKSPSGKQYNVFDEAIAFGGWRVSTFDPKTAIYYKSYDFSDDLRNASSILNQVARDPNKVDDDDLLSAYRSAKKAHKQAFEKMITLINAAKKSGLTNYDIARLLRSNKISKANTIALMKGIIPDWKPNSRTFMKSTIKRADSLFDEATQKEFIRRRSFILKQNQSG